MCAVVALEVRMDTPICTRRDDTRTIHSERARYSSARTWTSKDYRIGTARCTTSAE